jgi:hypothetical protein
VAADASGKWWWISPIIAAAFLWFTNWLRWKKHADICCSGSDKTSEELYNELPETAPKRAS